VDLVPEVHRDRVREGRGGLFALPRDLDALGIVERRLEEATGVVRERCVARLVDRERKSRATARSLAWAAW